MKLFKSFLLVAMLCILPSLNAQTRSLDLGLITNLSSIDLGEIQVGESVNLSFLVLNLGILDPDVSVSIDNSNSSGKLSVTLDEFDPSNPGVSEISVTITAETAGILNNSVFEVKAYGSINRLGLLGKVVTN
ncbi:MAG: hypothetical protein E6772_16545 [Dysgonomonas sp.]|nr:hypothetical protein [Dysgonomonas sp.]